MAPSDRIEANDEVVPDFVQKVLGYEPGDCLLTDESSLWDFHDEEDNAEYQRKTLFLYGISISDIDPPYISAIAERLRNSRGLTSACSRREPTHHPLS